MRRRWVLLLGLGLSCGSSPYQAPPDEFVFVRSFRQSGHTHISIMRHAPTGRCFFSQSNGHVPALYQVTDDLCEVKP